MTIMDVLMKNCGFNITFHNTDINGKNVLLKNICLYSNPVDSHIKFMVDVCEYKLYIYHTRGRDNMLRMTPTLTKDNNCRIIYNTFDIKVTKYHKTGGKKSKKKPTKKTKTKTTKKTKKKTTKKKYYILKLYY
jgi:hypothetical protein